MHAGRPMPHNSNNFKKLSCEGAMLSISARIKARSFPAISENGLRAEPSVVSTARLNEDRSIRGVTGTKDGKRLCAWRMLDMCSCEYIRLGMDELPNIRRENIITVERKEKHNETVESDSNKNIHCIKGKA